MQKLRDIILTFGMLKQKWLPKMEKIIIAALSNNTVIGNKGKIPWHISEDLKRFRRLTLGKLVIMGRKTYESIGKPLDKRVNLVVTRNREFSGKGIIICQSIEEALEKSEKYGKKIYISGGEEIYKQTIDLADRLELTRVNREVEGDSFFPQIDYNKWREIFRENHKDFSFVSYERIVGK